MPMSLIHKFVCVVAFYLIFVDHKRTCNAFSSFLHEPENTTQEVPSSSSGKSGTNSDYGDIEEKGINSEIAIKPCPTVNFCVSREHCAIRGESYTSLETLTNIIVCARVRLICIDYRRNIFFSF